MPPGGTRLEQIDGLVYLGESGFLLECKDKGTVDIVFANERELHSLYESADFDSAVKALRAEAKLAVVTRSEKGCVVVSREAVEAVAAEPVEQVVDVTGAGDMLAGSFLYGITHGIAPERAARCGNFLAMKVITQIGARLHHGTRQFWDEALAAG